MNRVTACEIAWFVDFCQKSRGKYIYYDENNYHMQQFICFMTLYIQEFYENVIFVFWNTAQNPKAVTQENCLFAQIFELKSK